MVDRTNRVVSVWAGSLPEAHQFLKEHALAEFFVQFLYDARNSWWVVLNIRGDVWAAVKSVPRTPRLTVME